MKESLEKINEIEDESTNDESVIEYLSSKIKCKFESKMGSMHLTNRKIYDLRERFTIDDIMINLNKHEEKGVSDFLINLMNTNTKILDKSFFYLNQLITMLSYKKYIYPYEQYICDKGICFIKFSVRISLYLNSFEKEHKGIRIMKFKIEQIMRANYSDIQDSQYQPKKKLKEDDFIITGAKNKNDMQVNYYYRCLEFFENLKKLCLLLFNYPIKLEGNTTDKKMTRKTALKEFIKLFNEDMDLMRGEEYDKMKKEEKINKKKNLNKTVYKNSKYNKGFILPFNNDKSNSDEHALIIVNILPEYSSPFSTKERVPVKLTCECIELGEAESENFFELYDNNKFFEKHNENILIEDNDNINLSLYSSNLSEVLEKQLSIFPKNDKIFDKWANLEKSLPLSKDELNKKDDKKIAMKETTSAFDDFVLLDFDIEQINPFGEPKEKNFEKIFKTSCFKKFSTYRVKCFIAKANDDMVQEMFALQLIKKFEEIFKSVNIFVKSYEVIITSSTSGLIEFLNNSSSIDGILKNIPKDWDLNKFFRYYFKGKDFARVQENFANSLAGFCLLSYYLDIKDRHNGNIMINNEGRIMHIDFGFLLGTSPKNLGFERAQFKLVKSYVDILDGFDGKMFKHFKAQMVNGLIETKKYFRIISTMIQIMSHTNMPCLAGQNIDTLIDNLNKKFLFGYTKEQIEKYVDEMIKNNYENFWTRKYDQFQYWTNGILY
jgi:hypothetical protein